MEKLEDEVKRVLVRHLPDSAYCVEKRLILTNRNLPREDIKKIIRNTYACREVEKLRQASAPAPVAPTPAPAAPVSQSNPHALAMGSGNGSR